MSGATFTTFKVLNDEKTKSIIISKQVRKERREGGKRFKVRKVGSCTSLTSFVFLVAVEEIV